MTEILKKLWAPRYPKWAEKLELRSDKNELVLSYRWIHSTQGYVPMLMAIFMSLAMLTGLYWIAWGFLAGVFPPVFMVIMGIFAVLLTPAFSILYTALAMMMNHTHVRMNEKEIRVSRGPLPWRGDFTRPVSDIKSIEAREVSIFYDLVLITKNGREKRLARTIHDYKGKVKDFAAKANRMAGS